MARTWPIFASLALAGALAGCPQARRAEDAADLDAPTGLDAGDAGLDASAGDAGLDASVGDAGLDASAGDAAPADVLSRPDATITACADAAASRAHYGCEHWVVDLDNAALRAGADASAQPLLLAITNPGTDAAVVTVERSTAPFGAVPVVAVLATATIAPGTSEVLSLGRLEVDGSSATGVNDGTHTALTAHGLRVSSTRPVAVVQVNGLSGAASFSSGVSLVFPSHVLGTRYTAVGWPQTIANSSSPAEDFDPTRTDEDLRAFLTIVGTTVATAVSVRLGPAVRRVLGAGTLSESGPGDTVSVTLGPFEVLNLETQAFGADFTGSVVTASAPVAVFVGVEGADVPHFTDLASRRCCADQLQLALPPDALAGTRFVVAREPSRARALNAAAAAPVVGELDAPEWIRVVSLDAAPTTLTTSLPAPLDEVIVPPGSFVELELTEDVVLSADRPVTVVHALPSQEATGVGAGYPGGDPSLFWVPAVEHHGWDHAFTVPGGMAFDALTIVAPSAATVTLDGAPLPATCTTTTVAEWTIRRCALSFPTLGSGFPPVLDPGLQGDGYHVLSGDAPFTAVWSGFGPFVGDAVAVGATFGP